MADWNRTDYDRMESEARWHATVLSRDTLDGIPPWLLVHCGLALTGLLLWAANG